MSIFDLDTDVLQVVGRTEAISKNNYQQVAPNRPVNKDSFSDGSIEYRFKTNGTRYWIPSRSYIRMRVKVTKPNGDVLNDVDDVAPVYGFASSLFQNAEFQMSGKTISRVGDFMPQIDALQTRMNNSKSWMESVGASTNFWSADFKHRQSDITGDGVLVREVTGDNTPSATYTRAELGFDLAGGTGIDRNAVAYDATTGILTASVNGGFTPLQDMRVAFPIGSYFEYVQIQGQVDYNDPRLREPAKVLEHISATQVRVELGVIPADVVADGRTNFERISASNVTGANDARKMKEFEIIYQPPLSIFQIQNALPCVDGALILNPQTKQSYQYNCIQSVKSAKTPDTDFKVEIENMFLYNNVVEGERVMNKSYVLDLPAINCQSETIDTTSFGQKDFTVSPATEKLTVAYQDNRIANDTRASASQFKVYDANYTKDSEELGLDRFFIQYASIKQPEIDADPTFDVNVDRTTQRYTDTLLNTSQLWNIGGAEDIQTFHKNGSYYTYNFNREGTDRSTRCSVHQQFKTGTTTTNMRVLLFSHYRQIAMIKIEDGLTTEVQLEEV